MMPGNPVVGSTVLRRPAIQSPNFVHEVSGWTINADGSAEFNNLTIRGTINGTDYIVDSTGAYFYTGAPALGNPPVVAISAAAADPEGNSIRPGDSLTQQGLIVLGSGGSFAQLAVSAGLAALLLGTGDAAETTFGFLDAVISGSGGTRQLLTELQSPGFGGNVAAIQLGSESEDTTINSFINLNCANRVNFGISQAAAWADGIQQMLLPAGGGPFISGESFHSVGGGVRVKLLPWNAVWIDAECSWSGTGTTTLGSLPSSAYYPVSDRHLPLASNASAAQNARLFVSATGTVQLVISGGSSSGQGGLSVMYPTN